jgi:hypothetical protein
VTDQAQARHCWITRSLDGLEISVRCLPQRGQGSSVCQVVMQVMRHQP